jgi:RNA polymerase sigma-70 factor (ECF subfamily)
LNCSERRESFKGDENNLKEICSARQLHYEMKREGSDSEEFIPTRQSLLERLKCWEDQESWRDFFDTYWRLLYGAAVKSGLNDAEAQDVVQGTVIIVARKMEDFKYDPAVDSFKGWLLYLTRKQIAQQYRKRAREHGGGGRARNLDELTQELEEIPEQAGAGLEALWEQEWERNLWDAAIAKVKQQVSAKQFQMFNLYVIKEWEAVDAGRTLGVPVAQVYLAKHRISALVKKELEQLRTKLA